MLKFSEYLIEAAGSSMAGNVKDPKGLRHVKNYVLPYFSKEQREQTLRNMIQHINPDEIKETGHGAQFDKHPEATTHTLVAKHKDPVTGQTYEKGERVRVTGVRHDQDGKIYAQTANHGDIQLSKLGTPAELAKGQKTQEGFTLEHNLQKNVDPSVEPAGSTGSAWDFTLRGGEPGGVRGKAVKNDETPPEFRGEAKASEKASMGTSVISFDPETKKWGFTNEKLAKQFAKAKHPTSGLPILDHLDKNHPDGVIKKGFSIKAPTGTSNAYLDSIKANALHLHRYAKNKSGAYTMNHGTSYTLGDDNPLRGKTNIGHLSRDDLDKLDGNLVIERTTTGKASIKHRPNITNYKAFADASRNDSTNHGDLSIEEHGKKFGTMARDTLNNMSSTLGPTVKPTATPETPRATAPVRTRPSIKTPSETSGYGLAANNPQSPISKWTGGNDGTWGGRQYRGPTE